MQKSYINIMFIYLIFKVNGKMDVALFTQEVFEL